MLDDQTAAAELAAIADRLAALAASGDEPDLIGAELGAIRAQLRLLATHNAEIGARLAASLGLTPASSEQLH